MIAYKIKELELSKSIMREAEGYITVLKILVKSDSIRIKAIQAYIYSFHGVFVVLTGISLLGLLAGYFIKRNRLNNVLNLNYDLSN